MDKKSKSHRTTPDPATITQIKGYPSKLIIYLCPASCFWQIRYFAGKTYHKKSSKTVVKQEAIELAKQFYDDINYQQRIGPQNKKELFEQQAVEWLKVEQARATRGQITQAFFTTLVKRFNKHVSPYYSGKLVNSCIARPTPPPRAFPLAVRAVAWPECACVACSLLFMQTTEKHEQM